MTESHNADPHVRVSSFFVEALKDAERLLKYAAEVGVEIDAPTRSAVLHARAVPHCRLGRGDVGEPLARPHHSRREA